MTPTILVLDDDEPTRELLQDVLEFEGYRVETVAAVGDAMARMAGAGIDLMLLDLALADSNGVEFCQQVRQQEQNRELPILVVSARADDQHHQAALAAGASEYIDKPFDLNELLALVRKYCPR